MHQQTKEINYDNEPKPTQHHVAAIIYFC